MRIWKASSGERIYPPGHYGGLQISEIVSRNVGETFTVATSFAPPRSGAEVHRHDEDTQVFFIVSGAIEFQFRGDRFTLGPMEAVTFLPGEEHSTYNRTDEEGIALVFTVQNGQE